MTESATLFGAEHSLVGITTHPIGPRSGSDAPAVIFLNSGLVHRVGPGRLTVRMARRCAERGLPAFRFDLSGIGDSAASRDRSDAATRWVSETRSAMDVLSSELGIDRFILVGNCSGAAISYLTALADTRVVGLGLINPQGHAAPRYFVRLALSRPQFWRRLLRGRVKLPGASSLMRKLLRHPQGERAGSAPGDEPRLDIPGTLSSLAGRGVQMLLVHCEWDPGYDYFHGSLASLWSGECLRERATLELIRGANHEFSIVAHQDRLVEIVDRWCSSVWCQR